MPQDARITVVVNPTKVDLEDVRSSLAEAVMAGQQGGHIPADADPLLVAGMISAVVDGFAHAAASVDAAALDAMTQLFDALILTGEAGTGS